MNSIIARNILKNFKTGQTKINPIETITTDWEYEFKGHSARPIYISSETLNIGFFYQISLRDLTEKIIFKGKLTFLDGKILINGESRIGFTKDGFMLGSEIEFAEDFLNSDTLETINPRDFEEGNIYKSSDDNLYYYIGKTSVLSLKEINNYSGNVNTWREFRRELVKGHIFRQVFVNSEDELIEFGEKLIKYSKNMSLVTHEIQLTRKFTPRYLKILSKYGVNKIGNREIYEGRELYFPDLKTSFGLTNILSLTLKELDVIRDNRSVEFIYGVNGQYLIPAKQRLHPYRDLFRKDIFIDKENFYTSEEEEKYFKFVKNGMDFEVRDLFAQIHNDKINNFMELKDIKEEFYSFELFIGQTYKEIQTNTTKKRASIKKILSDINIQKDLNIYINLL